MKKDGHSPKQYCQGDWILHMDRGEVTVRFRDEGAADDSREETNVRDTIRSILTESYRKRIVSDGSLPTDEVPNEATA